MIKFNVGHFTKGTVAEYSLTPFADTKYQIVVDHLVCNGAGSWVIVTDQDHELIPGIKKSVNISHVSKILKGGSNVLPIKKQVSHVPTINSWIRYKIYKYKHPSEYMVTEPAHVIYHIASRFLLYDQIIDMELLEHRLLVSGIFKQHFYNQPDWNDVITYYTVNKKKLKKRIKQLLPGCLMRLSKAKQIEQEIYQDAQRWDDID